MPTPALGVPVAPTTSVGVAAVQLLDEIIAAKHGGAPRTGQRRMAGAAGDAFATGEHVLVDAPTGSGKALGGISALVAWQESVNRTRGPGVIVTVTKALQEQLMDDDLPLVAETMAKRGKPLNYTLLKGRSNYLCEAKLNALGQGATSASPQLFNVASGDAARAAAADVVRLQEFALSTVTGDRAELDTDVVQAAWEQVSSTSAECPGKQRCPFGDVCLSEAAKTRAATADIIVVNTALYAAHMSSEHAVLPDHHVAMFDEAHSLWDSVTGALTEQISGSRIRRVAGALKSAGANGAIADRVMGAATTFDELASAAVQYATDSVVVAPSSGEFADVIGSMAADLMALSQEIRPESNTSPESMAATQASSVGMDLAESLAKVADPAAYPGNVAWVEPESRRMQFAPVDVTSQLANGLWNKVTILATSATLAVGERFDNFTINSGLRLSAKPYAELLVESPFDFAQQGALYVAKHLPDPRHADFVPAAQNEIGDLIEAAGGRTLALFTSHKAMREAADALRGRLALAGIDVSCQGDASRTRLVERLQDSAVTGGFVIFATQSFWTGVSIDGAGCSLVIIDKLPFARPTDPLAIARRERVEQSGGDAFRLVDLPRAATLLAQGAGRLIRTTSDRGVVAVLDKRLATAGYRAMLLTSMPPLRRTIDPTGVRVTLAKLADIAAGAPVPVPA